jgi:uncharacterized membrane protein YebE (DUF533 family)
MTRIARQGIATDEQGHAPPLIGVLIGAAGAVLLAIGSAGDFAALAIVGGIVLAAGLLAMSVLNHVTVDWEIFGRLEKLEK